MEHWSLWLRTLSDGTALVVLVPIHLEADDGKFCATVQGLGDSLLGMGDTEQEAIRSAELLLKGRVDHAIGQGDAIDRLVLGDVPFMIIPDSQTFVRPALPSPHDDFTPLPWAPASVLAGAGASA